VTLAERSSLESRTRIPIPVSSRSQINAPAALTYRANQASCSGGRAARPQGGVGSSCDPQRSNSGDRDSLLRTIPGSRPGRDSRRMGPQARVMECGMQSRVTSWQRGRCLEQRGSRGRRAPCVANRSSNLTPESGRAARPSGARYLPRPIVTSSVEQTPRRGKSPRDRQPPATSRLSAHGRVSSHFRTRVAPASPFHLMFKYKSARVHWHAK